MPNWLPLFPLPNVVLFPGMILPLHIFEERYKKMMKDALDSDARFGLLLCQEYSPGTLDGIPFDVGTVAELMQVETLDDGRLNILVVGTQRFRVHEFDETAKPYLLGQVQWIDDERDGYVTKKLLGETCDLFHEAIRLTHKVLKKEYTPFDLPAEAEDVSYFIAENLKGSLVLKQELLELSSTKARLMYERDVLNKMVKSLAVRSQIEDAFSDAY